MNGVEETIRWTNTWLAEVDEIDRRRNWAEALGGPEAVDKQHKQGRLTIRERVMHLLDEKSFRRSAHWQARAATSTVRYIMLCQPHTYVDSVASTAVRSRSAERISLSVVAPVGAVIVAKAAKVVFVEDMAFPIPDTVDQFDRRRGRHSDRRCHSRTYGVAGSARFRALRAIVGRRAGHQRCARYGCRRPGGASHSVSLVDYGQRIESDICRGAARGRAVVGSKVSKEELGGSHMAVDMAGTVDNVAANEEECFELIRRFLSYLPQNVYELPPTMPCEDPIDRKEERLLSIVPRDGDGPTTCSLSRWSSTKAPCSRSSRPSAKRSSPALHA